MTRKYVRRHIKPKVSQHTSESTLGKVDTVCQPALIKNGILKGIIFTPNKYRDDNYFKELAKLVDNRYKKPTIEEQNTYPPLP